MLQRVQEGYGVRDFIVSLDPMHYRRKTSLAVVYVDINVSRPL